MEIKIDSTYKGTRILFGDLARKKRRIINDMCYYLECRDFQEMMLPIIQLADTYQSKVGEENQNMMFTFKDRGDRNICLAPEYTAVIQQLAKTQFKYQKDVKLFYVAECFRGEKPQAGRYRQFTQFGVEVLNPSKEYDLETIAIGMVELNYNFVDDFVLNKNVTRGLDYYKDGKGFEITCEKLGAQKQVCGGGEYEGGIGFAFGIDRLLMLD